jgi:hypothetical protein
MTAEVASNGMMSIPSLKVTMRKQMEICTRGHEDTISLAFIKMEKWAERPRIRSSVIKKERGRKRFVASIWPKFKLFMQQCAS